MPGDMREKTEREPGGRERGSGTGTGKKDRGREDTVKQLGETER